MESCQEECPSSGTVLRHTQVHSGRGCYPENVDSNLSKTHPILLIWLPLNTTSSEKLKKEFDGHHFARDDDVMNAVDHVLKDQNGAFYTEVIRLLHDRRIKSVNVGGDYVDKMLYLIL